MYAGSAFGREMPGKCVEGYEKLFYVCWAEFRFCVLLSVQRFECLPVVNNSETQQPCSPTLPRMLLTHLLDGSTVSCFCFNKSFTILPFPEGFCEESLKKQYSCTTRLETHTVCASPAHVVPTCST